MNKKAQLRLGLLLSLFVIALVSFALSVGEVDDFPDVTVITPEIFSTVEHQFGYLFINVSASIPSGHTNNPLKNATLYLNITTNVNHTWFSNPDDDSFTKNYTAHNTSLNDMLVPNSTLDFNATAKNIYGSTNFTFYGLPDNTYVNYYVRVCNNVSGSAVDRGNCTNTANQSIYIDYHYDDTNPGISIMFPLNNTVVTNNTKEFGINFSATDNDFVQNITLWMNWSNHYNLTEEPCNDTHMFANKTLINTGIVTPFFTNTGNVSITGIFNNSFIGLSHAVDGFYCIRAEVYDFNSNSYNTSSYTFEIDNSPSPITNFYNYSALRECNMTTFKFNITEPSNITVNYGHTQTLLNLAVYDTSFTNGTRQINLTGLDDNRTYWYNITVCDEQINCNTTAHNVSIVPYFRTPWAACAGWNQYGVMSNNLSLLDAVANTTGATIVSYWNATNQDWINHVVGVPPNQNETRLKGGAIMMLMENSSVIKIGGFMDYNGNTSINVPVNISGYTNGNWTFAGALRPNLLGNISEGANMNNNVSVISTYNNSLHRYVDHFFSYSLNNNTRIDVGDVLWFHLGGSNAGAGLWHRNQSYNIR